MAHIHQSSAVETPNRLKYPDSGERREAPQRDGWSVPPFDRARESAWETDDTEVRSHLTSSSLLVNGCCITSVTCVALGSTWPGKMSEDFPPSNPFRRKPPVVQSTTDPTASHELFTPPNIIAYQSSSNAPEPAKLQTKVAKKVRVQSPPPSSPEDISIPQKPPTPIPRQDDVQSAADDPFDSSSSDVSDISDDGTTTVKSDYIPANPFQKTLATLEHTEGAQDPAPTTATSGGQKAGRASLDVDAFKRLLMTGSTGRTEISGPTGDVTPAALPYNMSSPPSTHTSHHALNDGTSTDTSSVSKQSLFEPIQENHPESPRTSHEVSDPDDERRGLRAESSSKSDRKKPPPPSSKHGKLIRVELRDDNLSSGLESPALLETKKSQQSLSGRSLLQSPSLTDLNKPLPAAPTKPLPAAPRRTSHDSDRESIFDVEAAGKRPEPPSPSSSVKRKIAPAPPLSRRHSQLISDSKLNSTPTGRLSPNFEEPLSYVESPPQIQSKAPPPPPPSRRPASIRNISYDIPVVSPPLSSPEPEKPMKSPAPAPPPTRMASKRLSGRPPSVHSLEVSNRRLSAVPPPPPPRQRASSGTSMEAPALSPGQPRTSNEYFRKSIEETRRGSQASQPEQMENVEADSASVVVTSDILADLAALQKEVDALRGVQEKEGVSQR